MTDLTTRLIVFSFCILFILLGAALIPYAGIQNDEALFAAPLYLHNSKDLCVDIFGRSIPLMVMSYIGTLKTLLYVPIFAIAGVTVWSVRLPMVIMGALTLWTSYRFAAETAGRFTALLTCALLATDPAFLLPDTFDWGPVALNQFLLMAGCLTLVRFGTKVPNSSPLLALGFFCLGLAVWNKAVFLWTLAGLVFGALVVLRKELRPLLNPRNVIFATAGFFLGASPILIYNLRNPNFTLASTAHLEAFNVASKLGFERMTLSGSGVLGFIPAEEWRDHPKEPWSRRGRMALWIRNHLGEHRTDGLDHAFILSLLAIPLWWRSRPARFSLAFLLAAWLAMAFTHGAGRAVHHAVLLWPFPHLFIATVLGALPWRRVAVLGCTTLVVLNLLVVNQHLLQLERDGAEGNFSDAVFALSAALPDPPGAAPRQPGPAQEPVYVLDWGMLNTLALLHQGRLALRPANDPFMTDSPGPGDLAMIQTMLADPNALFIDHVADRQVMTGVAERFERRLKEGGYEKRWIHTIPDSNNHPVFEIFHVRKIGSL